MLQNRGEMTPRKAAESSLPFNYAPQTPRERIEQDWEVRLPLAASPTGYLSQLTGASAWDGFDRLGAVDVPTLVVHGELDRLVPPANGERLAAAIPGAELVLVPRPTTSSGPTNRSWSSRPSWTGSPAGAVTMIRRVEVGEEHRQRHAPA